MFQSSTISNYRSVLTPIEAWQRLYVWQLLLKLFRKSKCYVSTNERTQQWCRGESGSNCLYKCLGYKASFFLPILEQRVEYCHLSLQTILDIRSAFNHTARANVCVSDSLTKTQKIPKPVFGTALWKHMVLKISPPTLQFYVCWTSGLCTLSNITEVSEYQYVPLYTYTLTIKNIRYTSIDSKSFLYTFGGYLIACECTTKVND